MLGVDVCEFGGQVLELLWITMCYKGLIGENEDELVETDALYTAPAQKSVKEIQEQDKDDESLVKYKNKLLGTLPSWTDCDDLPNVQVTRLTLLCDEAPKPITMDLTEDLSSLKNQSVTLKEGVPYRLKIHFKVNKEIVPGLKYHHVISRTGINVDKESIMVGSYGPRAEEHEFLSPVDETPKGMMARGCYKVQAKFIDDDENVHLKWEWGLNITKDW